MTDSTKTLWSVHSSKDERPVMRAWAKTKAEAERLMQDLQRQDGGREDAYWLLELDGKAIAKYQAMGMIPRDLDLG
jgi:hypothetical protein